MNRVKSDRVFHPSKTYPTWALISLAANGLLILVVGWFMRDYWSPIDYQVSAATGRESLLREEVPTLPSGLGRRHQLTYQKWVAILQQEAEVAATKQPQHLNILLGDSLSLWFPPDLLPTDKYWLNQGISGEITEGLRRRLKLFDRTRPEKIFLLIGINDLIRGVQDDTLLWNYRLSVRRLRRVHPQAEIVIQSILPHGGEESTWEGRDRLLAIPNSRIIALNQKLAAIAEEEKVKYLDLYPLFANPNGNLRPEFTTDGLHLNRQGYLVWRTVLQMYDRWNIGNNKEPAPID